MAYQVCTLGGVSYPHNPQKSTNPVIRRVAEVQGFLGIITQDWGFNASDRLITHEWDVMPYADYQVLLAAFNAGGTPAFVDEFGNAYTVIVKALDYDSLIAGGLLLTNIKLTMRVVS